MLLRKPGVFFTLLFIGVFLMVWMFIDSVIGRRLDRDHIQHQSEIVQTLALTDLCLFTEARYTRHPSMADIYAPFQDHPMSFEHFPSGSLMAPPVHLTPQARPAP